MPVIQDLSLGGLRPSGHALHVSRVLRPLLRLPPSAECPTSRPSALHPSTAARAGPEPPASHLGAPRGLRGPRERPAGAPTGPASLSARPPTTAGRTWAQRRPVSISVSWAGSGGAEGEAGEEGPVGAWRPGEVLWGGGHTHSGTLLKQGGQGLQGWGAHGAESSRRAEAPSLPLTRVKMLA